MPASQVWFKSSSCLARSNALACLLAFPLQISLLIYFIIILKKTVLCWEQGLGREENGELLMGIGVSFWEDEKVLELDGGDGCIKMRVYFMPLNGTLKNG